MKHCPFCKAEIEDNARFCLYCMRSLEEKKTVASPLPRYRKWPVLFMAGLFPVLIGICLLFFFSGSGAVENGKPTFAVSAATTTTISAQEGSRTVMGVVSTTEGAFTTNQTADDTTGTAPTSTVTENGGIGGTTARTTASAQSTTRPTAATTSATRQTAMTTKPSTTTQAATTTTTVVNASASYHYRKATDQDSLILSSLNFPEDAIILTGIRTPASNGVYVIPETVDGYRVIALAPQAFRGSNAKTVVLPKSVRDVWQEVFADCYALADVYMASGAVHIEPSAFVPVAERRVALTLHCQSDCHDEDYNYYRNESVREAYAAAYREWDGISVEWSVAQ